MLGWENRTGHINALIRQGAASGLSFLGFLEKEIKAFLESPHRKTMIEAEEYYEGKQAILGKQRTAIGKGGKKEVIGNLPNNQLVDNMYAMLVDQKTNYLFGKPMSIVTEDEKYGSELLNLLGSKRFMRMLKRLGMDSFNGGIGWLHPYVDEKGALKFRRFSPSEILPFWIDSDHCELELAVRIYDVQGYEGQQPRTITKVELYHSEGISHYVLQSGKLIPDVEKSDESYLIQDAQGENPKTLTWNKLPLIAFKYNPLEIPLIQRVKSLQDALNRITSNFTDNMEEDIRNTILVLVNYDGTDLGEFRHNLKTYGAVKVRTVDGIQGDVKSLQIEVNAENYKAIIDIIKKAIVSNGRGFDAKEDRFGNNPNELNLKSMYSEIDLDANMMETEYQASLEELLWFVNTYLRFGKQAAEFDEKVAFIFNRDIMISESGVINDIRNSEGILSHETLVGQHPYVDDVQAELNRIAKEREASLRDIDSYEGVFSKGPVKNEDE